MKIEENGTYFMPIAFGQSPPHEAGVFDDVWTASLSYLSTRDALAALLPEPFQPADEPIVTVIYQQCRSVNILNGGAYNLMGVNVAATFDGRRDQVSGNFCLVLWENQMVPITRGREILGIPKMLADVPDPEHTGDRAAVHVADRGRRLIEMDVAAGRELSHEETEALNQPRDDSNWFGWRYIPNINGFGAALSEPCSISAENRFASASEATGEIRYSDGAWADHPAGQDILGGLRKLVFVEARGGMIGSGSLTITRAKHRVLA